MISVSPYEHGDADLIDVQPLQRFEGLSHFCDAQAVAGMAFTVRQRVTGRILMVGGYIEPHPAYASLWGLLADDKGVDMIAITRRLREWIAGFPHKIVDCMVDVRFDVALRWAIMIGLTPGPVLRGRLPGGYDAIVCERFAS
jgi:hypothetical protein